MCKNVTNEVASDFGLEFGSHSARVYTGTQPLWYSQVSAVVTNLTSLQTSYNHSAHSYVFTCMGSCSRPGLLPSYHIKTRDSALSVKATRIDDQH